MQRVQLWRTKYFKPVESDSRMDFNIPIRYNHVATIFCECIDQIQSINQRIYTPVDLDNFRYKTLYQRFNKLCQYELKEENEAEFETYDYRVQKIYYISDFFCTLLNAIKIELYKNDDCTILTNLLTDFERMKQDENFVLNSKEMENYENWNRDIKLFEARIKQIDDKKSSLSAKLLLDCEDLKCECNTKMWYLQQWENASNEQLLYSYKIKSNKMEKEINDAKQNIEEELTSHVSKLTYLLSNISDMETEIKIWSKKYELQYNDLHIKILQIKEKREEIQELTAQMQKEYDTREKEIETLLICREKRKEESIKAKQQAEEKQRQIIEQKMLINLHNQQCLHTTPRSETSVKRKSRRKA